MDTKTIKELIKNGESVNVELKSSFSDEVIISLVAMANHRGGVVIIGVSDNRKIKGIDLNRESIGSWASEIRSKTQPFLSVEIENRIIDNKTVVIFEVAEFPLKPVSFKGRFYLRKNNGNHLLTLQEISEMYLRTKNSSWDFYPNKEKSLDDLDLEKIEKVKGMIESNLGIDLGGAFNFLRKYSLIVEEDGNDYPANASLLLFSKVPSRQTDIQIGLFQDDITIKKNKIIRQDLISEADEVMDFIKTYILKEFIITGRPQREERWQYPIDAIREIVINAIIHRDYQEGTHSQFRVYFDKLVLWNSGWLPFDFTIEDVKEGKRESKPRNKLVAEIFRDAGLIERYGSGVKRAIEQIKEYGLAEPLIEESSGGFRFTILSKEFGEKAREKTVEKTVEKIVDMIREAPAITTKELIMKTGLSRRGVEWNLSVLKEKGIIKRIGPDKGGHWEVLQS